MKTTYYLYTLIVIGLACSWGCENDLNVNPQSVITSSSMWQSEGDATASMYGALAQFRSAIGSDYIRWGDYRSGYFGDALGSQASYQDIYLNSLDDQDVGTNWAALYKAINDCNLILKYVPEIAFSKESDKQFVLANAHFIRAFSYYFLARVWGDAPILLSGFESDDQEDLFPSRAPQQEVLNQVAVDVDAALSLFPSNSAGSRKTGSMAAANMLKTDLNLWLYKTQNGGEAALQTANGAINQVLGNSDYALQNNYESIFRNEANEEIIFAINCERDEYESGFVTDWLVAVQYVNDKSLVEEFIKVGSHQQWVTFTDEFESFLYENPNDSRARVSLDFYEEVGNNRFKWINKYLGEWIDNTRYFTSDIPIYRYAEALLFKAEIENSMGNTSAAMGYLNTLAERAYGQTNHYTGELSQNNLDQIILEERLKEFAAEGKSWWDLIRFGEVFERVATLNGRESEQNILFWPVNVESINRNQNIEQTIGY
ncbi:MAG: RagB/SusD family nutrient uptake outer membrane protein [Arenibacter algicola]